VALPPAGAPAASAAPEIPVIPEAPSLGLVAAGLVGIGLLAGRRRRGGRAR
jgi:hypothetical protein